MKSKRIDGKTPHGGAYAVAYYSDADGNAADKEQAVNVEIVEFTKDGKEIERVYARIG